jgi:S1-C subfamily serine protease
VRAGLRATRRAPGGGLLAGDLIQAVDGRPVRRASDLLDALEGRSVGDRITLTLWRDGDTLQVELTLKR